MKADRHRGAMSEINVTPLVDVMLVLLIIFMVTAPLLQQGLDVDLPQAKGKDLPPEERITVLVKKDGSLWMDNEAVTLPDMSARLKALSSQSPSVFLKADKDVPYGKVVEVMGEVRAAGVDKLGMITEPRLIKER